MVHIFDLGVAKLQDCHKCEKSNCVHSLLRMVRRTRGQTLDIGLHHDQSIQRGQEREIQGIKSKCLKSLLRMVCKTRGQAYDLRL